jgi:dTDP-4-dehydrorhamnose reductase
MPTLPYESKQSIVVTGGAGMLAHAFAAAFARRGLRADFAPRKQCDISDAPQVEMLFEDLEPTLCINCAAFTKVDLAETAAKDADDVNGHALRTLGGLCREYSTTLIHFSTDYVFDGSLRRPLRPGDPVGPHSAYGRSKLLGEKLLQENAPERWLIIRTAWLYGSGGPNFVQTMLNAARAGKPLKVVNDQTGSPTFTHDLAEATLNLIDSGARGIYHVTNSGQTTWFDFTRAILEEFDLKADLSPMTSAEWKQMRPNSATRPAYSVLDCSDYEHVTGTKMPDWRDALHRYRLALSSSE